MANLELILKVPQRPPSFEAPSMNHFSVSLFAPHSTATCVFQVTFVWCVFFHLCVHYLSPPRIMGTASQAMIIASRKQSTQLVLRY